MTKKRIKLSDQIRRAVDASGLSRYRISKQIGVAESTMSRFMSEQGGLSMDNVDTLADLLDLNITVCKSTKPKKGSTRGEHQQ
jgi:cyanate lyase